MELSYINGGTQLSGVHDFSLKDTLDCGQCFRWDEMPDKSFSGVVGTHFLNISQDGDTLFFKDCTPDGVREIWIPYFDLDRDYAQIKEKISENPVLAKAAEYAPGIRILKQEPWEALCSFILSQNNNIKRIKGIVRTLCREFGEPLGNGEYTFPSYTVLAQKSVEDLAVLRAGFRAKYVLDAARRVNDALIDLEALKTAPVDEARKTLMEIHGVGPKVAECSLLYGFYRLECFPVDVWIRRALDELFDGNMPDCAKEYAGIAQQYLFHYVRTGDVLKEPETASAK